MWKTRVTRRVPLTVQELFTLTEFTAPGFSVVPVARSVVFCVVFCRSFIAVFLLVIVFYVLLRFTAFETLFGIYTLFLHERIISLKRFLFPFKVVQPRTYY